MTRKSEVNFYDTRMLISLNGFTVDHGWLGIIIVTPVWKQALIGILTQQKFGIIIVAPYGNKLP